MTRYRSQARQNHNVTITLILSLCCWHWWTGVQYSTYTVLPGRLVDVVTACRRLVIPGFRGSGAWRGSGSNASGSIGTALRLRSRWAATARGLVSCNGETRCHILRESGNTTVFTWGIIQSYISTDVRNLTCLAVIVPVSVATKPDQELTGFEAPRV